jgi:hypothetical protein
MERRPDAEASLLHREVDLSGLPVAGRFVAKLLWALTPVAALLSLFPWPFRDPDITLDYSWSLVLQHVHGTDLVFGRDLMLNYGPWGFAFFGYLPSTRALVMLSWVLLSQLFVLGLVAATRAHSRHVLGLASAWIALFVLSIPLPDVRILSFAPVLFALGAFETDRRHLLVGEIGIAPALGWVVTMKFSSFVIAIPVLIAHTWDQWATRRRISPVIPLFLGALVLAWIAAGEPVAAIPDWIDTSLQNVVGYGTAGVASDRFHARHPLWLFVAAAAFLGFAMTIHFVRTRRWQAIVPVAALALIFGVLLKAGYMRHDMGHQINPPMVFLVFVLALAPGMVAKGRWPEKALFAIAFLLAVQSANVVTQIDRRRDLPIVFAERAREAVIGIRDFAGRERALARFHADKMERIRTKYPVPPEIEEPVDLYSYMQSVVFAHELAYTPRPAFQSYFAWTPRLANANERFLHGPRAARSILFSIEPIDGRFPSFEDSLSYPTLLSLYEPRDVTDGFLVLRRRDAPVPVRLTPFGVVDGRVGEEIPLAPSDRPLWARVHVDLTAAGRAHRLMLRPPEIRMLAEIGGTTEDYRFIPDYGDMGFLISPVLRDHLDFRRLYESDDIDERALRSFRLTTGSATNDRRFLESGVRVELWVLEIERPARDESAPEEPVETTVP